MSNFGLKHRTALAALLGYAVILIARPTILAATVILPNLPPGSQYQLLFVTADMRDATSSNLAVYDAFVSQEAALSPSLPSTTWHAIVSNATINAFTHDVTYPSIPLYNTHGQLVAHGTSDFWYPSHLAPITYDQYGILEPNAEPWTGTNPNGTANNPFGNSTLGVRYAWASSYHSADWIASGTAGYNLYAGPFYAMSTPITVVPEPTALTLLGSSFLVIGGAGFFRWRRRATCFPALIAILTVCLLPSFCSAANYTITDLGINFTPVAINASGQIAGTIYPFVFGQSEFHAGLFSEGTIHDLGALPTYPSSETPNAYATGINNGGQVIGGSLETIQYSYPGREGYVTTTHGFVAGLGQGMLDIGPVYTPSGYLGLQIPHGINSSGQIVGSDYFGHAAINTPSSTSPATDLNSLLSPSPAWALKTADGINDSGQITGTGTLGGQTHAFLLDVEGIHDLGTSANSFHTAINALGEVAGTIIVDAPGHGHAFLYAGGTTHDLGTLLGTSNSSGEAINGNGQIVGSSGNVAFLYSDGVMKDLNSLIAPSSGWILWDAVGINDLGQIIGMGKGPNESTSFFLLTPIPVPEPSGVALASIALVALIVICRRRLRHIGFSAVVAAVRFRKRMVFLRSLLLAALVFAAGAHSLFAITWSKVDLEYGSSIELTDIAGNYIVGNVNFPIGGGIWGSSGNKGVLLDTNLGSGSQLFSYSYGANHFSSLSIFYGVAMDATIDNLAIVVGSSVVSQFPIAGYASLNVELYQDYQSFQNGLVFHDVEGGDVLQNDFIMVGQYFDYAGESHGMYHHGGFPGGLFTVTTLDYPGSVGTNIGGISGNMLSGDYTEESGGSRGFIYNTSTHVWTTLPDPSPTTHIASVYHISGNNVVGSFTDSSSVLHGFFYNGSSYTTLDYPGAVNTVAEGIDGNTVVGYYDDASGHRNGFVARNVPEPSSFVLTAAGFLGIAAWRWRRDRKTSR